MTAKSTSLLALALAFGSASAFATTITIGTTAAGTFGTATAFTLSSSVTAPTPANGATPFTATYNETVYRGGTGAFCATCVNLVFTFSNTAASGANPIERFSIDSLSAASMIAVDYIAGTGTQTPGTQANESFVGTLLFGFDGSSGAGNPILAGQSSDTLVIFTNANSVAAGTMTFGDGTTANVLGIAPANTSAVPEPSSLALLGTGLIGAAGVARRKFFKS